MINNKEALEKFVTQLGSVSKPDFNRVSISFIAPSIHTYTTGNLACTGIMGYYCNNRAAEDEINL